VSALGIAAIVLLASLAGTAIGSWLRSRLPSHHLSKEAEDVIKLATGLVATMAALILGLVVSSAKSDFDEYDTSYRQNVATILTLDETLGRYGPEAAPIRGTIRELTAARLALTTESPSHVVPDAIRLSSRLDLVLDQIQALEPRSDTQRWVKSRALDLAGEVMKIRWLVLEKQGSSTQGPFIVVLIFWLALIFASFGLFAPLHATALGVLALSAMSVAAAVFLILELAGPFDGLIQLSPEPLHFALSQLGK
jgi:hypothetical protein